LSPIGQTAYDFWQEIPRHFASVDTDEFIVMPNHIHGILVISETARGSKPDADEYDSDVAVGVEYIQPLQNMRPLHRIQPTHPDEPHGPEARPQPEPPQIEPLHEYQHVLPKSVGSIIRTYKAAVKRWCNKNGGEHFAWQRNYYEHVIRDEIDLNRIRNYIAGNPQIGSLTKKIQADRDEHDSVLQPMQICCKYHGLSRRDRGLAKQGLPHPIIRTGVLP
jgi:REP-associated tyrosine transposase